MDMIPIVWFAIASIEDDFQEAAVPISLRCPKMETRCGAPTFPRSAQPTYRMDPLLRRSSNGRLTWIITPCDTTNECLYDGPEADPHYGRPIDENTRFWRNSSRLFSSGNNERYRLRCRAPCCAERRIRYTVPLRSWHAAHVRGPSTLYLHDTVYNTHNNEYVGCIRSVARGGDSNSLRSYRRLAVQGGPGQTPSAHDTTATEAVPLDPTRAATR